jgi:hypothetical protein
VNRIRTAVAAALLVSFVGFQPTPTFAQNRDRRDRAEQKWEKREAQRERQEAQREWREERRAEARYYAQRSSWDAARYYRQDNNRYRATRMDRYDRVYRGSDNRYYCKRDDGTTGLIIGGVSGAVLGTIIAPGESKVLGTIIGAGAGALIGRAIDDGDIVCK